MSQRSPLAAGEAKLHDIHMPLPRKHWHGLCQRSVSGVKSCGATGGGCQSEGGASEEQELGGAFPPVVQLQVQEM